MKNSLFVLMTAVAFVWVTACSDDSGVDNASGATAGQESVALKNSNFEVGKGSCSGGHLEKRAEWGDESIDFVMNEDGSAVFFLNTIAGCAEYGRVTDIKLDRQGDTLLVHDVFEYYPDYNRGPTNECLCFADYRVKVPAEYIGVKYLNFYDVYTVVYKDKE
ncbi:hypothetical protein [Fibrobacter succinogenes]|uniref:hypothetical protein n=1 Tax=Fibrobacter succinogenes TaxID=833 RepID=UPI001569513F|nr:hypothetical protein [Fibrobacter succinogenes]